MEKKGKEHEEISEKSWSLVGVGPTEAEQAPRS
jgi:hypothetical protein